MVPTRLPAPCPNEEHRHVVVGESRVLLLLAVHFTTVST